jgi:hypothetical protein
MRFVTLIQKKLPLTLVGALISGTLVAISVPTTANAIAPVGAASSNVFLINGIPTGGIGVATINSASAIAMTDQTATAVARSVGLASYTATSTSATYQAATVQLGGTLSLFNLSATSMAYVADGGTFSSPVAAGFTNTITATAAAFTIAATSTGATLGKAVLWTAPSTAGTYTINGYVSTQGASASTYAAVTTTNFVVGTNFGRITVTVGGTHPAAGGTNAPDTLGITNSSLFVAVSASSGTTGVIHPTSTLGTGEDSAKSKGLLAKSDTFGTAQTATVLSGGVLSLYGVVSTAAAFSASGGSFSESQAGIAGEAVTYNSANTATVITGIVASNGASAVATLWTAPTTAGTYTISLLTGFVQDAGGATYSAPSTSSLPPTLSGKITVTVVATSAGGSYSAVYSACNTATTTTAASSTYPNGVDSTGRVADGGAWYIDFNLRDGYNAVLDSGNIVATATNGALINIGTTAGTAPVAGTASTDTEYANGSSETVMITQPTAGAPLTTTVTISYNGTTVCTKTVTIRGKVAKLTVANVGTQKLSGTTTGSPYWMYQENGIANDSLFTVVASDSAGNAVHTPTTYGTYSADAATLTTTVQGIAVTTRSTSSSTTGLAHYNYGTWYCGANAGSASVKLKFTIAGTGDVITSDAFTARCADSPYTFTATLDRASYIQGDIATVTLQFLDSKGNKANNVAAIGAGTFTLPMMTQIDDSASASAVTKADGTRVVKFSVAASGAAVTAGTYTGTISYGALAAAATATPTYKISTGSTDVAFSEILKSVVALIASINKQIQALQKLILNRKR